MREDVSAPASASIVPAADMKSFMGLNFAPIGVEAAAAILSRLPQGALYGYVVTPNVDHMVRLHRSRAHAELWKYYESAALVVNDSAVLSRLARWDGVALPRCPGSDLTEYLFRQVLKPGDAITIIGGSEATLASLERRFPSIIMHHHNPPMGFADHSDAVQACIDFIRRHHSRFILLAVGAPRQEMLAYRLRRYQDVRGWALCIGASLDFMTGAQSRAPLWMQRAGIEWLYRLVRHPRRLARRYLWDGPRILVFWWRCRARKK